MKIRTKTDLNTFTFKITTRIILHLSNTQHKKEAMMNENMRWSLGKRFYRFLPTRTAHAKHDLNSTANRHANGLE